MPALHTAAQYLNNSVVPSVIFRNTRWGEIRRLVLKAEISYLALLHGVYVVSPGLLATG